MIKAPIFVDESGALDVYETIEHAEIDHEAIDVRDNIYTAYDSEGRLLNLIAISNNKVTIQSAEEIPTHQEELRRKIKNFLSHVELSEDWLSRASLEDLVERSMEYKVTFESPLQQIWNGLRKLFDRLIESRDR